MSCVRDDTATTVCPSCDTRYLAQQRCDERNTWCRRLGPGGLCPCCDEPIAVADLLTPDQLAQPASAPNQPTRQRYGGRPVHDGYLLGLGDVVSLSLFRCLGGPTNPAASGTAPGGITTTLQQNPGQRLS